MGSNDFSASEAGKLPFPLTHFEARQHSHLRNSVGYVQLKTIQALNVVDDRELAVLLNGGQVSGSFVCVRECVGEKGGGGWQEGHLRVGERRKGERRRGMSSMHRPWASFHQSLAG
jgi:hypothetical protein